MNNSNRPLGRSITNTARGTASAAGNTMKQGWQKTKNTAGRAYQSFQGTSLLVKILIIILVIAIIVALFYWATYAYDTARQKSLESPFIITSPVNAFDSKVASKGHKLPESTDGLAFTYSFWIYVADWNYKFGKWKNIFVKGKPGTGRRSPGVWLYPKSNNMKITLNTSADPAESSDVKNIPLNKWVHVVIVLNNRTMDVYIDGKLERSLVLRGVPMLNRDDLYLVQDGGYFGQLSKMQYFNRPLEPADVASIYSQGPLVASRYRVRFFHDNKFVTTRRESGDE